MAKDIDKENEDELKNEEPVTLDNEVAATSDAATLASGDPNIANIKLNNTNYNVKDAEAREDITQLKSDLTELGSYVRVEGFSEYFSTSRIVAWEYCAQIRFGMNTTLALPGNTATTVCTLDSRFCPSSPYQTILPVARNSDEIVFALIAINTNGELLITPYTDISAGGNFNLSFVYVL